MKKICPKCEQLLDINAFSQYRPQGASYCKECQKEYSRKHYQKNKHKHNKRRLQNRKVARKRFKAFVEKAKRNKPCMDCGEIYEPFAMDFHHRDPHSKLFSIASAREAGYSKKKVQEEINKCDLICALCHRYRTYGKKRDVG